MANLLSISLIEANLISIVSDMNLQISPLKKKTTSYIMKNVKFINKIIKFQRKMKKSSCIYN